MMATGSLAAPPPLRTLLRMKMSGEIEQIIQLHTGETPDRN